MPPKRKIPHTPHPGWKKAVAMAGSQDALAAKLGIYQGDVSHYIAGLRKCRLGLALKLEEIYGIPRWLTRPDLFPAPEGE